MNQYFQESDTEKSLLIFRDLCKKHHENALDFEFCNGYILQATRNGFGSKEFGEGLVIFTKKRVGENYVIMAYAGKDRGKGVFKTAKVLFGESGKPVIIKNVGEGIENELLSLGCRHYRVKEWWDTQSKYDDNTFPEQILNCQEYIDLEGPKYQSLREEKARFEKSYEMEIRKWDNCEPDKIKDILGLWINKMSLRNGWEKDELLASHEPFCNSRSDLIHYGVYDSKNDNIIGFLVFSEISAKCLGFNVLVNNFDYRNSYRILMIEAAKISNQLGYKYLNIQGSEDTNQFLSKKRLKAEIEICKEHLIYDGTPY